jgi:Tfp pilus assembly protein PilE
MLSQKKLGRQAGLTMIEVVIASVILTVIVGMSSYLVWSSARTVSSSEAAMQAELQAREFLSTLTKELHQSKMVTLRQVNWDSTLTVTPATAFKSPYSATPGTAVPYAPCTVVPAYSGAIKIPATGVYLTGLTTFNAIRFKLPGTTMDLTTLNANHDTNATNFDLKAYKNGANLTNADFTYEIQYWWELQPDESSSPTTPGNAPNGLFPDGKDNNWNNVTDEGVIKKIETWYDIAGAVIRRTQSIVCRDVQWDAVNNRPGLVFSVPGADAGGTAYAAGSEKRLFVSLTIEKADPRYPKDPKKNIVKTVTTFIDVRN